MKKNKVSKIIFICLVSVLIVTAIATISLLVGGIVGIVLGGCLSIAVEFIRLLSYVISWKSCFIAFGFSVFVGIFFGLSPAIRASKLDPVVALSGE